MMMSRRHWPHMKIKVRDNVKQVAASFFVTTALRPLSILCSLDCTNCIISVIVQYLYRLCTLLIIVATVSICLYFDVSVYDHETCLLRVDFRLHLTSAGDHGKSRFRFSASDTTALEQTDDIEPHISACSPFSSLDDACFCG